MLQIDVIYSIILKKNVKVLTPLFSLVSVFKIRSSRLYPSPFVCSPDIQVVSLSVFVQLRHPISPTPDWNKCWCRNQSSTEM